MKLYASIVKSLREGIRDWKVLGLVLFFSPFFVFLMKLFFGSDPMTYQVGVLTADTGSYAQELLLNMENLKGENSEQLLKLSYTDSQAELEEKVRDKSIDIGIVIPADYSEELTANIAGKAVKPAVVKIYGSLGNTKYMVAAVLVNDIIYRQGMETAKISLPSGIEETFVDKNKVINEFDAFVPGLISLSVLMVIFSATASIVKESDKGTITRLKLSNLGTINVLGGVSIVQAVLAVIAIILSYWTALALGYKPAGSFSAVLAVGILSSLSMVAMSLILAGFLNTVFDVLTVGCFPFFILMFFSGCMFPLPKLTLFTLAGKSFGIVDALSLTHTVNAFNKIMNYGEGLADISYELAMITLLTLIYFVIGVLIYRKRKLSKA